MSNLKGGTFVPSGSNLEKHQYTGEELLQARQNFDVLMPLTSATSGVAPIFKSMVNYAVLGKTYTMAAIDGLRKAVKVNDADLHGSGEFLSAYETSITMEKVAKLTDMPPEWAASESEVGDTLRNIPTMKSMTLEFLRRTELQNDLDTMQGRKQNSSTNIWDKPTHVINSAVGLSRNLLTELSHYASSNMRMVNGKQCVKMRPIPMKSSDSYESGGYILLVDRTTAADFLLSNNYFDLADKDIRGREQNMLFKNVMVKIGNITIIVVETSASEIKTVRQVVGTTMDDREICFNMGDCDIDEAGMRVMDGNGNISGEALFDPLNIRKGRMVLLGANALIKKSNSGGTQLGLEQKKYGQGYEVYANEYYSSRKLQWSNSTNNNDRIANAAGFDANILLIDVPISPAIAQDVISIREEEKRKEIERIDTMNNDNRNKNNTDIKWE